MDYAAGVGRGIARRVRRAGISRREFLKLGGAGLAGAAMLGTAGCGGGAGGDEITFTFGPDNSGGLQTLIDRFNAALKDEVPVEQALETLQRELQEIVDQG
ncbi:hypothetical protein BH24ACT19_BH24ACT19_22040 [soil metagenome]